MTRKLRRGGIASLVLLLALAVGCASEDRGTRDAPVDASLQDNEAPFIINGPDQFHNLALKCVDADLVIVHTRQAAPVVVQAASACKPGEAEKFGIPRVRGVVPSAG